MTMTYKELIRIRDRYQGKILHSYNEKDDSGRVISRHIGQVKFLSNDGVCTICNLFSKDEIKINFIELEHMGEIKSISDGGICTLYNPLSKEKVTINFVERNININ